MLPRILSFTPERFPGSSEVQCCRPENSLGGEAGRLQANGQTCTGHEDGHDFYNMEGGGR